MNNCRLIIYISALLTVFALTGCAKKIVRPNEVPSAGLGMAGPGAIAEGELQGVQTSLKTIYFDFDNYTLSPEAQAAINYDADVLKRYPNLTVVAEGHCDERGTAEYNLALGERRAGAVVERLTALGIPGARLSTVSFGSELPVDPNHNEQAWAKNRRVYLRVSK
ncbi:MAG: peptidoglycan-associated lipoprotein Pal [Deltaproteobacteria bacterium]|nr:peptidoglycan-associated lipoprotein Pal [Deltaproteobacteria bacterium]